jgi:hypothetical protein
MNGGKDKGDEGMLRFAPDHRGKVRRGAPAAGPPGKASGRARATEFSEEPGTYFRSKNLRVDTISRACPSVDCRVCIL